MDLKNVKRKGNYVEGEFEGIDYGWNETKNVKIHFSIELSNDQNRSFPESPYRTLSIKENGHLVYLYEDGWVMNGSGASKLARQAFGVLKLLLNKSVTA